LLRSALALAGSYTLGACGKTKPATWRYAVVGHGKEPDEPSPSEAPVITDTRIAVMDLERAATRMVAVPYKAHEVVMHPRTPTLAFAPSKWGREGGVIDLAQATSQQVVAAGPTSRFFGHAAFSPDGTRLYCSIMDDEAVAGFISVRAWPSLEEVERFSTYGLFPHQLRLTEDGRAAWVANGGASVGYDADRIAKSVLAEPLRTRRSTLVKVDLTTGAMLERLECMITNLSHFVRWTPSQFFVSGFRRADGDHLPVALMAEQREPILLHTDEPLIPHQRLEVLSLAYDAGRQLMYATCPHAGKVMTFDLGGTLRSMSSAFEKPRGIAYRDDTLFISAGTKLSIIDAPAFLRGEVKTRSVLDAGNGSHLAMA
jgi:hypothetical protein